MLPAAGRGEGMVHWMLGVGCVHPAPVEVAAPAPTVPALDPARLAAFVARAEVAQTSALIITSKGETSWSAGRVGVPTVVMSVSKSVTSLLVGRLVDDGHLDLREPLGARLLPEWKGTPKEAITTWHLLSQLSGLPNERGDDITAFGLALEPVAPPGRFLYSNGASDLVAVVAERAHPDHLQLDDQLENLGLPLGIVGDVWLKDPAGVPRAAGELYLRPVDLHKLGQLVLARGRWGDEQVVSEAWIDAMIGPAGWDGYGLMWWRERAADGTLMVRADGYLGQFVAIVPDEGLVVTRTRDPRLVPGEVESASWKGYVADVWALIGKAPVERK